MYANQLATHDVVTLRPDQSLDAAIALMEEHEVHHLPVVAGDGQVVGMISDRDLLLAVGWKLAAERRIKGFDGKVAGPSRIEEIMSRHVTALAINDSVEHAARLMADCKFGALPILAGGRIHGIVTETDLLRWIRNSNNRSDPHRKLLEQSTCDLMSLSVKTVQPTATLGEIVRIFGQKRIRHVPVVTNSLLGTQVLIGMISDRDLRRALGESAVCDQLAQEDGDFYLGPTKAKDIMTSPVRTAESSTPLARIIDEMLRHRIHALPILTAHLLVGIITETDIVRAISRQEWSAAIATILHVRRNDLARLRL